MTPDPPSDRITTWIGSSTADSITVAGRDLANELMGSVTLTELTYLLVTRREPTAGERRLLDAVLASGRAAISGTEVNGNYTLRLAVMHYRTHLNHVEELIELLVTQAERLEAA